jgi:uncharacterized repeat protein (TIGR02543 family)
VDVVGSGTVTLYPLGGTYNVGTEVTLTATADPDWLFCGWSGDLTGVDNPKAVTMDGNRNVTAKFIKVELVSGIKFTSLIAVDPDDIGETAGKPQDFPYGMIQIEIEVAPFDTAAVSLTLPNPAPAGYDWYKYTATLGWLAFGRDGISGGTGEGAAFNATRDQVTLYITDNGPYDTDPTPGVIKDPSGLGSTGTSQPPQSGGGGGGGCFIATAASGSTPLALMGLLLAVMSACMVVLFRRKS